MRLRWGIVALYRFVELEVAGRVVGHQGEGVLPFARVGRASMGVRAVTRM